MDEGVSRALSRIDIHGTNTCIRSGIKVPFAPNRYNPSSLPKLIGYASTFKFVSKDDPLPEVPSVEEHGFPPGRHWVDWSRPDTVVLIEQPASQRCAALGGIMSARMKVLGVKGVVVSGRVRDLAELKASGLQVRRV